MEVSIEEQVEKKVSGFKEMELRELLPIKDLLKVLSHLPVKSLLGFKCISKKYCHSVSTDRSFIKDQLEKTELVLSGFIFQEKMFADEDLKGKSYINIPSLDHHHNRRPPKSVVHNNIFGFLPEDVVVLSSCNGLLCCRSCGSMTSPRKTTFYVCNPTNKQRIPLDCPDFDRFESFALAFDPCKDPIDISTKFNLVRVKQDDFVIAKDEIWFCTCFEIYSSETKSWKRSKASCLYKHAVMENPPGIYIKGVLYWRADIGHILTSDDILAFDVEKESSLVISPPTSSQECRATCVGEWKGILHYVIITKHGLHVWALNDYEEAKWEQKVWKSLGEIGADSKIRDKLVNLALKSIASSGVSWWIGLLSFKDGVLLMMLEDEVYFYDIEKNMMVEACNHRDLSAEQLPCSVLPYSMSLVPL